MFHAKITFSRRLADVVSTAALSRNLVIAAAVTRSILHALLRAATSVDVSFSCSSGKPVLEFFQGRVQPIWIWLSQLPHGISGSLTKHSPLPSREVMSVVDCKTLLLVFILPFRNTTPPTRTKEGRDLKTSETWMFA